LTCLLKAGIVEPEEMDIAREWLCKHISTATHVTAVTDTNSTTKNCWRRYLLLGPSGDYIRRPAGQAREAAGSPRESKSETEAVTPGGGVGTEAEEST
jgi:hypothetical protein